jgi:hypothetical protein
MYSSPRLGGAFSTGSQMGPELRLLDLVRSHRWTVLIVLCTMGNSILETVEAPLLLCAYLAGVLLLDRWVQWMEGAAGYARPHESRSAFPSSSGNRAMLTATRRASSVVSTFACRASSSLSRL